CNRLGHAADRQLAVHLDVAVISDADIGRSELDSRALRGVEEVRREEVLLEVRNRGLDRLRLRDAGQNAILEPGIHLLELASERRYAVVLDRKPERAVNGVEAVGAGRDRLGSRSAHPVAPSCVAIVERATTLAANAFCVNCF